MSEQFALEEVLGDGAAVDRDERPVLAGAATVDGEGGHFLAGAAVAEDEDRGIGGGHFADQVEHFLHRRAGADHALEASDGTAFAQLPILTFELSDMKRADQDPFELAHVDRFREEIVGALADGFQGIGLFVLTGDDDDLGDRIEGEQIGQRRQALGGVGGRRGQAEVEQDDGRSMRPERVERGGAIAGGVQIVIVRECPFHLGTDRFVVVDQEEGGFHGLSRMREAGRAELGVGSL